jgi:hypothetical protein
MKLQLKYFPVKKFWFLPLAIALIVTGCSSSSKLIEKGDYDKAIDKSVKKLIKDPSSQEDAVTLDKAYRLANERDINRIELLKSENRPENWEPIYHTYIRLNNRQENVKKVLPLHIGSRQINYQMKDYSSDIAESKANAARYFYDNGNRLMEMGLKDSYRDAYYNFLKAKQYGGSTFPDIEKRIDDARYFGTSRVLIEVVNNSYIKLPQEFYDNILLIDNRQLDSDWVEYYISQGGRDTEYDYVINLVIKSIEVTPEQYDRHEYVKEKTIQDGFDYVLDRRGNVKKDSLGNDIKVPRYVDLRCRVVERRQYKSAHVEGEVEYVSLNPERILKREPVGASSVFEHVSARAKGDLRALDEATRQLIKTNPLPFPDDMSMIMDCSGTLQMAFNDILRENKHLLK